MKPKCRKVVWWPKINCDVEPFFRACSSCVISGKFIKPSQAPLQSIAFPERPQIKICLEIFGLIASAPHHLRFAIVVTDFYSK